MCRFRGVKGETIFSDGHSDMYEYFLEKETGGEWKKVLTLELESRRLSDGKIDILYRNKTKADELIIHAGNPASERISDYYISYDGGLRWYSVFLDKEPDEKEYSRELLER